MKKQPIIIFTIIFLASSFFFSCGKGKRDQIGKIKFDKIEVNTSAYLLEDTISPNCNLRIEYTYPIQTENPALMDNVNKTLINHCFGEQYYGMETTLAIDSFKNDYIRNYQTDLRSLYLEDLNNNNNDVTIPAWYSYYLTIEAEPLTGNPNFLNYRINTHEFTGGAHGSYYTLFMNFDPSTGHLLSLEDIFKNGYYETLNEKLLNRLVKISGASVPEELPEKGFLQWSDIYPSKEFYLDKNQITFFYNIYEIAPYSMGPTEISVPYSEIKEWLQIKY